MRYKRSEFWDTPNGKAVEKYRKPKREEKYNAAREKLASLPAHEDSRQFYGRRTPRSQKMFNTYGIYERDFNALLKSQGNKCAICESDDPAGKNWHIDHDHSKDYMDIRGILCGRCNVMIGQARDNTDTLRKAIKYLGE